MVSATLDTHALGQLVAEAQQGDRSAADRLIRSHDRWVRSIVYSVTGRVDLVDDVAQQVWTRVWQRLDTLREPRRMRSWLYNIARNASIDAGIASSGFRRTSGKTRRTQTQRRRRDRTRSRAFCRPLCRQRVRLCRLGPCRHPHRRAPGPGRTGRTDPALMK